MVRTRSAGRAGHARDDLLRSQPQPGVGVGVRRGPGGARAERRLRVQGALLPRAVGLEGAAAPAGGAALRRGRRHLRQGRQPRSARQGALSGGAVVRLGGEPRRRDGALRADRGRARRPQLRRRRARADGGARDRRRRRGGRRQDPGRGADALPAGRSAERGALAAGFCRLARRPARRGAALAGREPAPRPARGDLVRRGAGSILEGARAREAGARRRRARLVRAGGARVPAVGLRAAGAGAAQVARTTTPRRRWSPRCARGCTRCRPGRSRRARSTAIRGSCARWSSARMGQGVGRPARARPGWGWRRRPTSTRRRRSRRPPAPRGRTSSGSPPRCSTAAASGAPRTRSRATASRRYRLAYPQGLGVAKWKLAYPRAFPALVAKNTKANNLPEALELAIMREESAFSPEDRVVRQRHRPHADAGQDGQALLRRRARHARRAARSRPRTSSWARAFWAFSGSTSTARRR